MVGLSLVYLNTVVKKMQREREGAEAVKSPRYTVNRTYLPYLIGAAACFVAEIVFLFFAISSKSVFTLVLSIISILASGAITFFIGKESIKKVN